MADWYLPNPNRPNGIGKYSRASSKPGVGWVEGPSPVYGAPERMKLWHGFVQPATEQEYYEWFIQPDEEKNAAMVALQEAIKDLPGVVIEGTPDEIQAAVQAQVDSINDLPTAKTALANTLPAIGKCIGILRDLVLYMRDAKNG